MKILMLSYEFPPIGGGGGQVSFRLSQYLVQSGNHVDVVTMQYGDLPSYEKVKGIHVYRTPAYRSKAEICNTIEMSTYLLGALPKVVELIKKNRYDVIHAHFIVPTGFLACAATKLSGIPLLITAHGSDVPGHNPERFKLAHRMIKPVWRFILKQASAIISPSNSLKNKILLHCPNIHINVIPNGIQLQQFNITSKKKNIIMCSRILPFKGFQYVLEALKSMDMDWEIHIIGEGPYLADLKLLAHQVKAKVKFWGWLEHGDTQFNELFGTGSIFIFPSEAENFPTVLLEAMSAGMAVITSNVGGCPEVVGDAALLIEPRDIKAIRKSVEKLIDSEYLRLTLSHAAQERAKIFSWRNVANQYQKIYEEITQTIS